MTIASISPYQILDSRGEPTILVVMHSDTGKSASFSVPAGASKGLGEASEKRDEDMQTFRGNGVTSAIELINTIIGPKFIGYPLNQQDDFDGLLIALDGSQNKQNLGANTLLALSVAYLKLSALETKKPVWQYIAETAGTMPEFPRLFANIVGGGKHAPGLDIQEYMIVPQSKSPLESIKTIYDVYHTTQNIMQSLYGPSAQLVGDEGGLAPLGTSTEVILETFAQLNSKREQKFDVALDSAANTFYKDGLYTIENQSIHASDLMKLYEGWNAKFPIFAIEDPFAEKDLEGMQIIKSLPKDQKPFFVVADDYTVTNEARIAELQKDAIFDAIVIKPNQVGTVTEVFAACAAARASKAKIIVSHRSGETNDDFIVDLAYGLGAMGLKLGAPVRGERVAKYNRLLQIQADLESNQQDAGAKSTNSNTSPTPVSNFLQAERSNVATQPPTPAPPTPPATRPVPLAQPAPQPLAPIMPASPLNTSPAAMNNISTQPAMQTPPAQQPFRPVTPTQPSPPAAPAAGQPPSLSL